MRARTKKVFPLDDALLVGELAGLLGDKFVAPVGRSVAAVGERQILMATPASSARVADLVGHGATIQPRAGRVSPATGSRDPGRSRLLGTRCRGLEMPTDDVTWGSGACFT